MNDNTSSPDNYQSVQNNLKTIMQERGIPFLGYELILDDQIHRYSSRDSHPEEKDEWYIGSLFEDGKYSITFASYRIPESKTTYQSFNPQAFPELQERMNEIYRKIDEDKQKIEKEQIPKAKAKWESLLHYAEHPYLTKKKIKPHGVRVGGKFLYVPLYDIDGNFKTLQSIPETGKKLFFKGIGVKGLLHIVGNPMAIRS